MEAAILISGLSLFLVASLIYLRWSYRAAPMWAWSSLLLPPIAVVFYVLHWRQSWQLFTIHAVGVVLFVIGSILFVRVHPDWIEDTWLVYMRDNLAPASLNRPLDVELDEFASRKEVSPFIGRIDGVIGGRLFGEGVYLSLIHI